MVMALDRWIAVMFLLICLIYGYVAFFTMDARLPPFMQRNPIWPSTLPKLLAVLGGATAFIVIFAKPPASGPDTDAIDYRNLGKYRLGHALLLMGLMVVYALSLRGAGFLLSTSLFLFVSGYVLGERKLHILIPVAVIAAGSIWYLVQEVLGIFLRPWPWFMGI
jgi:putative tricarboxylic transport membrane protein